MSEIDNDLLQFISEDQGPGYDISNRESWKLIVADDDVEVHAVTALALSNFTFKDKPLNMISAFSAEETRRLIIDNPDTAVILLDVVMENHDSGLQLVKFIRESAKNNLVRIILRTGQPGYAPELEVITEYDINDYKEKTELTSSKLVTTIISSIRNFDDLRRIEESRLSLSTVAAISAEMHELDSQKPLRSAVYSSLVHVINSLDSELSNDFTIFGGILEEDKIHISGGIGEYKSLNETKSLKKLISREIYERIDLTKPQRQMIFHNNDCAMIMMYKEGQQLLIYLQDIPRLNEMKKSILRTFSLNIATVTRNIELMEQQRKTEKEIRQSLDEKLILVKEIHHRVKNNLQIISSLLHMQRSRIKDETLLAVIQESEDRVQSMSLVHEKLYQSDLMATINFSEYIGSLAEKLISSYSVHENVTLAIESDPLMLSINTAIPCGLIVNEILTNAIKYAFPGNRAGEIRISLKVQNEQISLRIGDNGIGLPADLDPQKMKSLGMKLIQVLTDQIDGEINIERKEGTIYTLSFSESEERES